MKIAIVVAGLIVVVAAVLVAVQPGFLKPASLALVKKSDILGFSPGMTFDETNKLVTQRRYRCRQIRDSYVLECAVDGAKVTIFADDVDPGNPDPKHPIWRVIAELNNPGPQDAASNRSPTSSTPSQPGTPGTDGYGLSAVGSS
jgi:hypothetical protein